MGSEKKEDPLATVLDKQIAAVGNIKSALEELMMWCKTDNLPPNKLGNSPEENTTIFPQDNSGNGKPFCF